MRHPRTLGSVLLGLSCIGLLLAGGPAAASGFGLFQHDGRGVGQVGALTARAPDPSAVTYNPAGITALEGLQLEIGVDFNNATNEYMSATAGTIEAHHVINFPPNLYLTYKPKASRWSFGVGIDAPFWYTENWDPVFFPGRFLNRRFELSLFELHPVVAYDLGDGWSVGGGVRYDYGTMRQGDNLFVTALAGGSPLQPVPVEVVRGEDGKVDAFAYDLAAQYRTNVWGWGATYRSASRLSGTGDATYEPRDVPIDPTIRAQIATLATSGTARQSFDLPWELRSGVWIAPYPELRLELDVAYQNWSSIPDTRIVYDPSPSLPQGGAQARITPRDWKNTTSLRLGVEGDLSAELTLYGGISYEPSPVRDSNLEPQFPRGDAYVYGAGLTYNFPQLSFDAAYAQHMHQDRNLTGQELNPTVPGRYTASDKVWSVSARWRF
ncbi:MAG TPA: outer membrane protein transport protein [Thermoanaerobaculia bacterium]